MKTLMAVHAESGFAVTANAEQLRRFTAVHVEDGTLDNLDDDDLRKEYEALITAVKADLHRDTIVTTDDCQAMVAGWKEHLSAVAQHPPIYEHGKRLPIEHTLLSTQHALTLPTTLPVVAVPRRLLAAIAALRRHRRKAACRHRRPRCIR